MRKRNWQKYNKELVQRGSITFLIDPNFFRTLRMKRAKNPGRPVQYPDSVIELLAFVKVHFKLAYRALQGFADCFLTNFFPNRKAPNYTLVCKRIKDLGKHLPQLPSNQEAVVILDASGMKIQGEGEWKVKIHGRGRPRKWVKVHLAVDAETQEIVAEVLTEANVGDSKMVATLLDQMKNQPNQIIADGGYDKKQAREEIKQRKIRSLIPPPRNARYKGSTSERDRAILEIIGLGGDRRARSLWAKLTGYNLRVLVETAFSSLKRLFGDRFFSKTFERQQVESRIRCLIVNKLRERMA
jgi:IS5 family transposase